MNDYSKTRDTQYVFDNAAQEYLQYLREKHPEHFMESTAQATQRKITVESFDLIAAERTDVHVYSELLIQWRDANNEIRRVVPDNMIVLAEDAPNVRTNFAISVQKARPFWVMEYISNSNSRKDYQQSFDKYELELKVPYYLMFYPDGQEMTLYQLKRGESKYVSVKPNRQGRYGIAKLDIEMKILDGWVRFWWQGTLLPLPADLQRQVNTLRQQLDEQTRRLDEQTRNLEDKDRRLDEQARQMAEMRAELERLRGTGS